MRSIRLGILPALLLAVFTLPASAQVNPTQNPLLAPGRLRALAADPTSSSSIQYLYTKDVLGTEQLFFQGDGAATQLTGAGFGASGWTDDGATIRLSTIGDNVGIGTATPGTKLDVFGEIRTDSDIRILESIGATFYAILDVGNLSADQTYEFSGTGGVVWTSGNDGSSSGLDADLLDGYHESSFALLNGRGGGQTLTGGTGATDGLILKATSDPTPGELTFQTNGTTEVMRILAGGNVGIGTSVPGSKLDVKGTLRLSGATSGYVGLAPAAAAGSTTYTLPSADGTSGQFLSTDGAGLLAWATASAGGGNVSIGTAVSGGTTGSILYVGAGPVLAQDNANLFWNSGSGLLGINTFSPTAMVTIGSGSVTNGSLALVSTGGNATTITSSGAMGGNVAWTLPGAQGGASTVLTNDGAGLLSWASMASAGGWTDDGATVRLTTIGDSVGIGTASPATRLQVEGNLKLEGSAVQVQGFDAAGTAAGIIEFPNTAGQPIFFRRGSGATGNARLNLASSAVTATLELSGNTGSRTFTFPDATGTLALLDGVSGGQTLIGGTAASNSLTLQATSNATDGDIIFQSDGTPTERMRILSTGSVAIGTTTAVGILDVQGNNAIVARNTDSTTPGSVIIRNDTGSAAQMRLHVGGSGQGGSQLGVTSANAAFLLAEGASLSAMAVGTVTADSLIFSTSDTPRGRFLSSGYFGLNVTVPETFLHISGANVDNRGELSIASTNYAQITLYGGASVSTDLGFQLYYDVAQSRTVMQSWNDYDTITYGVIALNPTGGNVGIGGLGPDRHLDVLDASNPQLRLTNVDGTTFADFNENSTGNLVISLTGGTGNVGIASTVPASKLAVDGTFTATAGDISLGTLGKKFKIIEGGNASMGTAALTAGTVTVSTTAVTSTSRIFVLGQDDNGGTPGFLRVTARTASTSFTVTSSTGALDSSIIAWILMEPF